MIRRTWGFCGLAAAAVSVALVGGSGAAQEPGPQPANKGAGERIGETVDRAAGRLKEGVRETAESLRESFARARTSVQAMGVQARVYSRLHWDKSLNDAALDLDVRRDGVATLRGAVADARAKARALELAQDTVGVTRVIDQLTIRPPSSDPGTTTTTKTRTTTTRP